MSDSSTNLNGPVYYLCIFLFSLFTLDNNWCCQISVIQKCCFKE